MILTITKATNVTTFRSHLKEKLDSVFNEKTTLIVTRNNDENVVVMSENQYNEIIKELHNLEYEMKLNQSFQQAKQRKVTETSLEELEIYESE